MKAAPLIFLSALLAPALYADTGDHLIPAGSLLGCTISEPKLSSKNAAIGDPVLCQVGHAERYGRSVLPYNSYLVGRFEDYKDPGHFVGKGFMELRFDHMVIEPDTIIPVDARVVDVPGYKVDAQGRILGKGHAVRDAVLWSIPILWPIDLLMLPMRGPRPTLKEETRLTLKVMDDLEVPSTTRPQPDPYGLYRRPTAYDYPPSAPAQEQPMPQQAYDPSLDAAPQPAPYSYPAPAPTYVPQPAPIYAVPAPAPVYGYAPMAVAPPTVYGSITIAPRAYGYAAPRMMPPRPAYGYPARPFAGYGYSGAPRAGAMPYASRPNMQAYGYGAGRPGFAARGGMGLRGYGR